MAVSDKAIREEILRMAETRTRDKTFCPSEVARALSDEWRPLMERVRSVAQQEVKAGTIVALQKGKVVDIATVEGPIRLRLA